MANMDLEAAAIKKWMSLHDTCVQKSLPFDLTIAQIKKLFSRKTCYYTEEPFVIYGELRNFRMTFDRVKPELGYVFSNIVPCTLVANRLKANMSFEHIEKMYLKLKERED